MKSQLKSMLSFALLLGSALWSPLQATARAEEHGDETISASIKVEMWTTAGVPSMDVYVDTVDGHVVLSGKVETAAERDAAEKVAHTVEGVKDVRNLLQVVPPSAEKVVALADKEIAAGVKRAFSSERALAGTQIVVQSVSNGVVLLSGEAKTFSEQMYAIATARLVKGVRTVASQVTGPRVLSEKEIADGSATRAGRDVFITTAVKLRLFADRAVPSLRVNVDSRFGMVVLFGTVPTEAAKRAAERDARSVRGVDRVLNDLQVVPEADRKQVAARDDVVEAAVKKALESRGEMKKVSVTVKNAVVHLTGSVASVPAKLRATVTARTTDGVDGVDNDLTVNHKK